LAGGQKAIDNAYGGPECKRHSHEHDNKDRDFPLGYAFHFSARIEPISPPYFNSNYFAAKRPSPDTPVLEKVTLCCQPCSEGMQFPASIPSGSARSFERLVETMIPLFRNLKPGPSGRLPVEHHFKLSLHDPKSAARSRDGSRDCQYFPMLF
jgi:hypothetical protein